MNGVMLCEYLAHDRNFKFLMLSILSSHCSLRRGQLPLELLAVAQKEMTDCRLLFDFSSLTCKG
jgi:hypothetical protein